MTAMDLDLAQIERREVVLVLQERDGFVRRSQRQVAMFVAADDAIGFVGIDVGRVEEAHLEFPEEHGRDQVIELGFLEHAFAHQLDQAQVAVGIGQFDIDAGLDRERARLLAVFGNEMPVGIGPIAELPDGEVVGDHETLEAPLLAQHVAHQPFVGVGGDAVDLVVRGHEGDGAGLAQGFAEGEEKCFAEDAHGDVGGGAVHAGLGLPVADEVLEGGEDASLVTESGVALEPADRGDAEARDQERILAVGLFHAAPARLASHVHNRRQRLMGAAEAGLGCGGGEDALHQLGIEGGAERDGLGEAGAVHGRVAVQALLVEHDGNAEAAVFEEEFLDGVGQLGHAARIEAAAGVAGAANLAEAAPVFE